MRCAGDKAWGRRPEGRLSGELALRFVSPSFAKDLQIAIEVDAKWLYEEMRKEALASVQ